MTPLNMDLLFRQTALRLTLFAGVVFAGSSCQKSEHLPESPDGINGEPVAIAPVGAAPVPGLLTRINLENGSIVQQINYNKQQQPFIINHYLKNALEVKDSVVYDASGKLVKVLTYAQDIFSPKRFVLSEYTKFELDASGRVSRKSSYDQQLGSLMEDSRYVYNAAGKVVQITTKMGGGANVTIVRKLTYSGNNIVQATTGEGAKVGSRFLATAFDSRPTYVTHPLLPYLLDIADGEAFSQNNVLETKEIQYLNLGNKQDSTVKVTKNVYQYNAGNRPVKVAFTSLYYNTGNQQPVTSKGTIDYSYSK